MANDLKYEIILNRRRDDEAFVAEVPELPGCAAAAGATYQEALSNAEIVIGQWLENARELGREIPVPRGRWIHA